jgi:hypothetical protein
MNSGQAAPVVRIGMWSGPRNISTAMMRAWENRPDTRVTDEPFYAHYLQATGIDHPGRDAIIASQSTDWQTVAAECASGSDGTQTIHYQKHMTQHLLPHMSLEWINNLVNVFLIRTPEAVVSSYARARPDLTPADLGFEQQHRLYQHLTEQQADEPLIIAADDVLRDPHATLSAICNTAGVPFSSAMLSWPAGARDSDGVWAPYWYENVQKSTGFGPYREKEINLTPAQQKIADECQPFYERLHAARFRLPG